MASGSRKVAWLIVAIVVATAGAVLFVSVREKREWQKRLEQAPTVDPSAFGGPEASDPAAEEEPPEQPEPLSTEEESPAAEPMPVEAAVEPLDEAEEEPDAPSQGERIADAQTTLIMNMAYGPFFEELSLDPASREQAVVLMVEAARGVRTVAQQALQSKDKTAAEIKAVEDEAEARLREGLSEVLDPAEMAAWDEYKEYADQIMYAQLLDGQLTMLSPGLTAEGREVVKEVFAEELKLYLDAFGESDAIYSLDTFNQTQLDALIAGLERLEGVLEADQLGHAEGFVKQVETMFSAMAGQ